MKILSKKAIFATIVAICATVFMLASVGNVQGQNVYISARTLINGELPECNMIDTLFVYNPGLSHHSFYVNPFPFGTNIHSFSGDTLPITIDTHLAFNSDEWNSPGITQIVFVDSVHASGLVDQNLCGADPIILHAGDSVQLPSYLWSNGDTTEMISTNISGNYWIQKIGACNTVTDSFTLEFVNPQSNLCISSYDPTTQKNKSYWDGTDLSLVWAFLLKRDIFNQMQIVDTVPASTGSWIDFSSQPQGQQDEYAIFFEDTCGNYTDTSSHHKTIWLQISDYGGDVYFQYTSYVGAVVLTYTLYGVTSAGVSDSLRSVAASFNYLYLPDSTANRYVKFYIGFPVTCSGMKAVLTVKSNIVFGLTGITDRNPSVRMYPNPTTGILNLEGLTGEYTINVLDWSGRLIKRAGNEKSIDLSNLSPSIYTLQIVTETGISTRKVVKQ